jgi:hypothetical protein
MNRMDIAKEAMDDFIMTYIDSIDDWQKLQAQN